MNKEVSPDSPDAHSDAGILRECLRLAAEGVAAEDVENIFRELVKYLAIALDVQHAFIGVLEPGRNDLVHIIAGYFFREFNDGSIYSLENTPCENVIGQQFRYYPERAQEMFSDPHLKELKTEGYAGIPLFDSRGNVLGLMAVADSKPLQSLSLTEDLLKIFSVRAAVELERGHAVQARSEKEQQLRKSEDRMRATVEAALDCIIAMDSNGYIIEFNPASEQCFGYKKFDILGQPLAELIIPERFRDRHVKGLSRFLKSGKGAFLKKRVEVTAMRADGSEFPAELAIDVAQGAEGEIYIGYLRDITERHEAEQQRQQLETQLRQAQKMEAIGQLTGGIAHDFNNILTTMTGYVLLAGEQVEALGDDKLIRYLDRAQRSGKRASDLIQKMLTFSRGQQGETQPVALAPLIQEWIALLESTLSSSVEIKTVLDTNLPTAQLDPVQLEQVLMNLCINARDAMQGHGILTVSLGHGSYDDSVCASCRQPVSGQYLEISVTDTGSGITNDVLERMFEPFYSTKEIGQGSGMGLSMVHGIIHEHKGHLLVDSHPEQGSTFRVLLPVPDNIDTHEETTAVEDTAPQDKRLDGRIMLVDDQPEVSEFMQDLLEQWGLQITVFNNSVEACKHFSDDPEQYELVILDQTMPRMTGLEAAQQLLKLRPAMPVILYTGYNEKISEAQVQQLGVRALVSKPVDTVSLYRLLSDLLNQ